ncbi:MAG: hypothetical protein R2874_03775 [Desulfobacterales bacterium]
MAFKRHQINRRVIDDLKNRSTIGMYFYLAITIAVLATDDFYKNHVMFSAFSCLPCYLSPYSGLLTITCLIKSKASPV